MAVLSAVGVGHQAYFVGAAVAFAALCRSSVRHGSATARDYSATALGLCTPGADFRRILAWTPGLVLDYARASRVAIDPPPLGWVTLAGVAAHVYRYARALRRGEPL